MLRYGVCIDNRYQFTDTFIVLHFLTQLEKLTFDRSE